MIDNSRVHVLTKVQATDKKPTLINDNESESDYCFPTPKI
jgi:hypothetical protein